MRPPRNKYTLTALTLLSIIIVFAVRSFICERELREVKRLSGCDFAPFMIESALMYGYAWNVANGKGIPVYDHGLAGVEDIPVRGQMFIGLEYFLGWGYRLYAALTGGMPQGRGAYEDNPAFADWARFQTRLWISLIGGMIFLWLILARVPWKFAFCGALLYALSPAAIARSTGQDLLRESFALPILMATLLCAQWIRHSPKPWKFPLFGFLVFSAFAFWDGPQMFFMVWSGMELLRILVGGRITMKSRHLWLTAYVAIILAAILVPYHRHHNLLASPLSVMSLPLLIFMLFLPPRNLVARWRYALTAAAIIAAIYHGLSSAFANYSHFASLLSAKLRFMNSKPADPSLLDFDARILWTPALHSANWQLTRAFFPWALPLTALMAVVATCIARPIPWLRRKLPQLFFPLGLCIIFFIVYIFFVRAHVFCAIFLCLALPVLAHSLIKGFRHRRVATLCVMSIITATIAAEAYTSFKLKRQYDSSFLKSSAELIRWFRQNQLNGVTVMCDMTLSPLMKGYCGARIVTQPQFELKATRDIVEEYMRLLYHGDMKEFSAFCSRFQTDIVIFDRASGYDLPLHIYSSRYIADGRKLNRQAPAWKMDKESGNLKELFPLRPPPEFKVVSNCYYVFRHVPESSFIQAVKLAGMAEVYRKNGNYPIAEKMAATAYALAPNSEKAYIAYFNVFQTTPPDPLDFSWKTSEACK